MHNGKFGFDCHRPDCPYYNERETCPGDKLDMFGCKGDWINYYLKNGNISPECAGAWILTQLMFRYAVENPTNRNIEAFVNARNKALKHHKPTGDCYSDKIEFSFNVCSTMDEGAQLQKIVARDEDSELRRMAIVEIGKRNFKKGESC